MLVSAISANHYNMVTNKRPIIDNRNINNKKIVETSYQDIITETNKNLNTDEIYKSINEWKKFCHHQIMDGKLNIIA